MADEVIKTSEIKSTSDGIVKISVEKYNELLEKAASKPPVINRTTVIKTAKMVADENRMFGGTLMGVGLSMFIFGLVRYKAGLVSS